jgi:hypothetical protein
MEDLKLNFWRSYYQIKYKFSYCYKFCYELIIRLKKLYFIEIILIIFLLIIFLLIIYDFFFPFIFNKNQFFFELNFFLTKINSDLDNNLLKYLFIAFSAVFTLLILSIRNQQLKNQSETQFKIFQGSKEFDNFLEATKLLTDKDSTIQAKISAIYLLYDIANKHSDNLDRVIQILNKELTTLIKCLENDCNTNVLKKEESGKNIKKTIKEWEYKGNDAEKLTAVILKVLKKIVIDFVLYKDKQIDLSNTILFDIDTEFDKNLVFKTTKRPVENLIFLHCQLKIVNFKKVKYYSTKFINCDLNGSDFSNANLWGTDFINCNLKNVKFNKTECEGVTFYNSELTKEQIKLMKFKFKNKVSKIKKKNEIKKGLCRCCDKDICDDNFYPIFHNLFIDNINYFHISNIEEIDEIYKEFIKKKKSFIRNTKR